MIDFDFERLRPLGLTPALAQAALTLEHSGLGASDPLSSTPPALMRATEVHRETVRLHDGRAECSARVPLRVQRMFADEAADLAVGDWVLAAPDAHGQTWVRARVPAASRLVRRDADGRRHAVVSNVDTAVLVMGLDEDFNPRRLERYLTLVLGSGIQPVVVLTKADVAPLSEGDLEARVALLRARVGRGVALFAVDATAAATAAQLQPWCAAGQTLVLLGSSGAGKSTLTNTLLGAAVQDTGAVRAHDSRGKHTTTSRSLHGLPGGACVIDTPGLRALRPDADAASVAAVFADIDALAASCRFRDCTHGDEPGCAVRPQVDADRVRNYHKLLREARRDTLNALERQRQVAQWKARGRAGRARLKQKRGE